MKSLIRTYCLLTSLLVVTCLFPECGSGLACAAVNDSLNYSQASQVSGLLNQKNASSTKVLVQGSSNIVPDTASKVAKDTASLVVYKPDPQKAIWYSALCPGLGQFYNRRYWKLPVVAAAVVGVAYGIGWNQKYYTAYTNAYRDISDNNPNTRSYMNVLPAGYTESDAQGLSDVFKNRQQTYRRSRDLSVLGAVGVYLICMIDAYVDAQLYDFDISPDLSLLPPRNSTQFAGGVELSLAFHF